MSQYNNNKQRAAALRYSEAENHVPVVVAVGVGYTVSKIIEVAQGSNIPVFQDDTLTSPLSQMNMGAKILPGPYQAVADLHLCFPNYGEPQASPVAPDAPRAPLVPEMLDFSEE